MTVKELMNLLEEFDPDLTVRYCYDSGHSYPTFVRVYLHRDEVEGDEEFVYLDEDYDL